MVTLLVPVGALLIGIYFGSTLEHTSDWLWLAAMAGGLVMVLLAALLAVIHRRNVLQPVRHR